MIPVGLVCSWSGSWRCVRRRAVSCRSTPTRCCSRSQTTAPTSWSRWSTRWKSRANAAAAATAASADASDLQTSLSSRPGLHTAGGCGDEMLWFLGKQLLFLLSIQPCNYSSSAPPPPPPPTSCSIC